MKTIDLSRYAHDRHKEKERGKASPGPVITLSREFGCPAKILASEFVETLNKRITKNKWGWVSKEILEKAAKELDVKPSERT